MNVFMSILELLLQILFKKIKIKFWKKSLENKGTLSTLIFQIFFCLCTWIYLSFQGSSNFCFASLPGSTFPFMGPSL